MKTFFHWSRLWVVGTVLVIFGSSPAGAVQRAATVEDTVLQRTVASLCLSPDARRIAAVIRTPDLVANRNRHELVLLETSDGTQHLLLEADDITGLAWDAAGGEIHAQLENKGRYRIVSISTATGEVRELAAQDRKINAFAVAPNGVTCVFTTASDPDPAELEQIRDNGFVYEWGRDTLLTLLERKYRDGAWEIFHIVEKGAVRELTRLPFTGMARHIDFIDRLAFSPDEKWLAVGLSRRGQPERGGPAFDGEVRVFGLADGLWRDPMRDSILTEMAPAWSADSQRVLFLHQRGFRLYDVSSDRVEDLAWSVLPEPRPYLVQLEYNSAEGSAAARTTRGLYRIDFKRHEVNTLVASGLRSGASFDVSLSAYALVDEASERRPEIGLRKVGSDETRRLTNLNPYLDGLALGPVEKLKFSSVGGEAVEGYLIRPVDYQVDRRYPLVVATYGFRGGFILQGEWHSSFPAQALAGRGYVVLLLNRPMSKAQSLVGNPAEARRQEGWAMLQCFEQAIDELVARGIADPDRLGLYGWSHGAFIVEFLLAHSQKNFTAACAGEGGDYNPAAGWLGGHKAAVGIYQNLFGGLMSRDTLPAYLEFSPSLKAERMRTPLLLEFAENAALVGLEMYVPLKAHSIPTELVAYPGEEHNFVQPRARSASMQRKIDWFDFWMLNKEDTDSAKVDQYARWRKMKADWETAKAASKAAALLVTKGGSL